MRLKHMQRKRKSDRLCLFNFRLGKDFDADRVGSVMFFAIIDELL